jgi:hypothetical protein
MKSKLKKTSAICVVVPLVMACGAPQASPGTTVPKSATLPPKKRETTKKKETPAAVRAADASVDTNREIVPLLNPIPTPMPGAEDLPEDPALIRKEAIRLLSNGNRKEALPLIDVLLILNPLDLEMLETRGRILVGQGLIEDGAVDLGRCCEEGRETCCH